MKAPSALSVRQSEPWPNLNASCGGALSATPARTTQARRIRPGLIVKPAKLLRIDSIGCLGVVTDPIRARFSIRPVLRHPGDWPECYLFSVALAARLRRARELLRKVSVMRVFVAGGTGVVGQRLV